MSTSSDWSGRTSTGPESARGDANHHHVEVRQQDGGWSVVIVDAGGTDVSSRACHDETEAWTYASTVRQHAYWLSDEKFREYYQLAQEQGGSGGSRSERERASGSPQEQGGSGG